jgi:NMT1/THI5 like
VESLRIFWMDSDRLPYLYVLKYAAEQYGVTMEFEAVRATVGTWDARKFGDLLAAGECDILPEAYYALDLARAQGQPFVSIGSAINNINEQLFVHPEIESIDDLRGKPFVTRGQYPTHRITEHWLSDAGLLDDVKLVPAPDAEVGRWSLWKKVASGEGYGCFVSNLYARAPRDAGLRQLPVEPYGFLANVVLTTTTKIAEEKHDAMLALMRGAFDVPGLFRDQPDVVRGVLERELGPILKPPFARVDIPAEREFVVETIGSELAEQPIPTAEAISNFRRMWRAQYPELEEDNPLLGWDFSFARSVVDERNLRVGLPDGHWTGRWIG